MICFLASVIMYFRLLPILTTRLPCLSCSQLKVAFTVTYACSSTFRTPKTNPNEFTLADQGLWFALSNEEYQRLYPGNFISPFSRSQIEAFCEYAFMIRKPFLDIVNCMKFMIPHAPVNRFMLYGKRGSGKSATLKHLIYYAHKEGYIVCHCQDMRRYNRAMLNRELLPSLWKHGRIDMPVPAVTWLKDFLHVNKELLRKYEIKTTKDYRWTDREKTPAGEPLSYLIEFGINRIKFAADCVGAVMRELKICANEKRAKVFVSVDHVNSLYDAETTMKRDDLMWAEGTRVIAKRELRFEEPEFARASELSLNHAIEKMIRNDWTNGVIVFVVDNMEPDYKRGSMRRTMTALKPFASYMPRSLLSKVAFDSLNPFIPIKVANFNDVEVHSMVNYFIDRHWVILPEGADEREAKEQLKYLSGSNPRLLEFICGTI